MTRNTDKPKRRLLDFLVGATPHHKAKPPGSRPRSASRPWGAELVKSHPPPRSRPRSASQPRGAELVKSHPPSGSRPRSASRPRGVDVEHGSAVAVTGVAPELDDGVDPAYDAVDRNWVRYRPRWGSLPRLLLFVCVLLASVFWGRTRIYKWVDDQIHPDGIEEPVEYTIAPGASVNDVATALHSAGVIANATVFRYWLRCDGELSISRFLTCDADTPIIAGDYEFTTNMDFDRALEVLSAGPVSSDREVLATITIPEGLRWSETMEVLLRQNPSFNRKELEAAFVSLVDESDYLPEDTEHPTLEGLLFPATYDISGSGLTDEYSFLRRLVREFNRRFSNLLIENSGLSPELQDLGLRPYDIIIVASLIEEEALVSEDRAKIARVIYNRLAVNEYLGIDASVCYASDKPCLELTTEDLRRESPWNTRVVKGLPPTPISAPSEVSLQAALQPAEGEWLFYVLTDAGGVKGAHYFSMTVQEHNEQVQVCREMGYCG